MWVNERCLMGVQDKRRKGRSGGGWAASYQRTCSRDPSELDEWWAYDAHAPLHRSHNSDVCNWTRRYHTSMAISSIRLTSFAFVANVMRAIHT